MTLAMWFEQWRRDTEEEPNRRRLLSLYDDAYQMREDDPEAAGSDQAGESAERGGQ